MNRETAKTVGLRQNILCGVKETHKNFQVQQNEECLRGERRNPADGRVNYHLQFDDSRPNLYSTIYQSISNIETCFKNTQAVDFVRLE